MLARLLAAVLPLFLYSQVEACQEPKADLVLRNGKIVTVDAKLGVAEALAVRDGRIIAVGTEQEIAGYIDSTNTQVLDLKGKIAVPGFIEGRASDEELRSRDQGS